MNCVVTSLSNLEILFDESSFSSDSDVFLIYSFMFSVCIDKLHPEHIGFKLSVVNLPPSDSASHVDICKVALVYFDDTTTKAICRTNIFYLFKNN